MKLTAAFIHDVTRSAAESLMAFVTRKLIPHSKRPRVLVLGQPYPSLVPPLNRHPETSGVLSTQSTPIEPGSPTIQRVRA